jgi:uncharacterized SAM-binding protein YcdF (DUF218 family)
VSAFFYWFCNPVADFIVLLVTAIILYLYKKEKLAFIFFSLGIGWILLTSSTPFPQWLVYTLERKYPVFDSANYDFRPPVKILVLGGGHSYEPGLPASMKLSGTASARLVEGLRIYKQLKGSKLVGSGSSLTKRMTLAEVQAIAAVELGVSEGDTLQSREPTNTAEEIQAYKKRFGENGSLILVTSAIHMPRAIILCKKFGVEAIPAPTEFFLKKDPERSLYDFKPSVRKMEMVESALHEYAGMLKEKWTD